MKKPIKSMLVAALLAALFSGSCVRRQVVETVETQRDSLAGVVEAKDSLLNAFFADFNSIAENLALIKSRENLLTVEADGEGERRPAQEINDDIAAIDRLLQENKARVAALQQTSARLRAANLRIEELDRTIAVLNSQLLEKSAEIDRLRGELEQRGTEVAALTETVAARGVEIESLHEEKTTLENRLNTVYYIVGAERELRDAQIITKQGFIGRTLTAGNNGQLESFTVADARLLTEIAVGHKRVTLVTPHPEESYRLEMSEKIVERLVIIDPVRFWDSSKILIVSYR